MIHTNLAEHKSHTLTHGSTNGKEYAIEGQFQGDFVMRVASSQHRDGDAHKGDRHGNDGSGPDALAQGKPRHDGSGDWGEGHEQLAKFGPDDDVALEEAEIANHIAHNAREHHPAISLGAGLGRQRGACHDPEEDGREDESNAHAHHIEREIAHALAAKLAQQCCCGPREGHADGYEFT